MADETTSIYLKLAGDDISPAHVRMATLFGVLGALERAFEEMAHEMGVKFEEHEAIIIPDHIAESSLGIAATINRKANDPLRRIDRAFYADELDDLPATVRGELRAIQSTLGRRGVRLQMSGPGIRGIDLTEDTPHIEEPSEARDQMTSHAVVYGVCMRVNRTSRDARIELHDGSGCTLQKLSDDHIRKLMKETGEDLRLPFAV